MDLRRSNLIAAAYAVIFLAAIQSIAVAQQTVDDALKADNATGQGADMLKIAAWIVVFVFLVGGGIVVGGKAIMHGMNEGKWGNAIAGLAFGALLCLTPALVGYIMGVDLFQMFGIN
ncbi:MAG: hypothetical protein A3F84_29465 [Candidatus Handelsmanbacteria bacterium RIFCSPLOWO2_12_FULL_64_10]|uniref:Conjugal transfer protein TrbC n=1 Tax=Handelsmanbacteria sp. (strain RIFCSPLOWO2_12_FULL_64_10) TaxID=1817868 RepID=A0A1F6CBN0_HANXR|nr:MAG: hypothetical protein A3F84_29465 [Candidatus Handelsmanbacteria bacterium RIFCSPLOWO2_12_FULL_64_10]